MFDQVLISPHNIKWTSDENKEEHQPGHILVIKHRILRTDIKEMDGNSKENFNFEFDTGRATALCTKPWQMSISTKINLFFR